MQSMLRVGFFIGVAVLSSVAVSIWTPVGVFAQLSASRIISIEGAITQQQVLDKEGKMIEVNLPSQLGRDIETDRFAASGQGVRAVSATVAAIVPQDTPPQTAQVTVITSKGQIVTIEVPTGNLQGVKRGDQLTLHIP